MAEIDPTQTQEEVAAAALASWRAARDAGPSEQSMRDQLRASTAVRQRRESDARAVEAHRLETRRAALRGQPPPPAPKVTHATEWDAREAELKAAEEKSRTDRAAAEGHRKEQQSFLDFCKGRYDLAMRNGNTRLADVWFESAEAITQDKWPISKLINSDPGVMKFAPLRTRLNYQGKNVQLED